MLGLSGPNLSLEQPPTHTPKWWREGASFAAEFFKNRYMSNGNPILADDILNITRASIAYASDTHGNLIPFAVNKPRVTNKGLLIEPTATNICNYSEPYQDTFPYGGSAASYTRIDIDWLGLFTKAVTAEYVGSTSGVYQSVLYGVGTYRVTIYARASDGSPITPSLSTGAGDFKVHISGSNLSDLTQELVDPVLGIYKITWLAVISSVGAQNTGILQYAGQAGKIIEWTGMQVEVGEVATSPIITTGSPAATRPSDIVRADNIATILAGMSRATIILDIDVNNSVAIGQRYISISDGSAVNMIFIYNGGTTTSNYIQLNASGGTSGVVDIGAFSDGKNRIAMHIATDGTLSVSLNGQAVLTAPTPLGDLSVLTQCTLGGAYNAAVGVVSLFSEITILDHECPP